MSPVSFCILPLRHSPPFEIIFPFRVCLTVVHVDSYRQLLNTVPVLGVVAHTLPTVHAEGLTRQTRHPLLWRTQGTVPFTTHTQSTQNNTGCVGVTLSRSLLFSQCVCVCVWGEWSVSVGVGAVCVL